MCRAHALRPKGSALHVNFQAHAQQLYRLLRAVLHAPLSLLIPRRLRNRPCLHNVERSKLQVEARKWVAARLLPKKYRDRLDLKHNDDTENPLAFTLTRIDPREST